MSLLMAPLFHPQKLVDAVTLYMQLHGAQNSTTCAPAPLLVLSCSCGTVPHQPPGVRRLQKQYAARNLESAKRALDAACLAAHGKLVGSRAPHRLLLGLRTTSG